MYVTLFRVLTSYSVNKNIDRCITLGRFVIKSSTDERLTQIKRLLVRHTRKKEVDLLTMVQWFNIGAVSFLHFLSEGCRP